MFLFYLLQTRILNLEECKKRRLPQLGHIIPILPSSFSLFFNHKNKNLFILFHLITHHIAGTTWTHPQHHLSEPQTPPHRWPVGHHLRSSRTTGDLWMSSSIAKLVYFIVHVLKNNKYGSSRFLRCLQLLVLSMPPCHRNWVFIVSKNWGFVVKHEFVCKRLSNL